MQGRPVRKEWRRAMPANTVSSSRSEEQTKLFANVVSRDSTKKGSVKARLHELCAKEHWKMPEYECCYEEGPPHQRWFAFVVVLQVEGPQATSLECYGEQRTTKKAAADSAAEAALWCLENMGY